MNVLKKIDIHVHTTPEKDMTRENGETYATPEELIDIYNSIGVERGVILPEIGPECASDTQTNREIRQITEKYPDRFSWFCNIDPRQGNNSPDTDFSRFLTHYKSRGARGIGEISANMYFDNPMMMNLFRHAEKCGMPVIFHIGAPGGGDYGICDDFGLPHLEKALTAFPKLRFIGHSQKFWSHLSGDITEKYWNGYPTGPVTQNGRIVLLMRKYTNLCCDLSAGSGYNAMTRDTEFSYAFLEEFSDRIFYGTDICAPNLNAPMLKTASFLDEAMENGKLSYEAYKKICRGNALSLLGLPDIDQK